MLNNDTRLLESLATQRHESFFQQDWNTYKSLIGEHLSKAKILVIGGAGSIGSEFVRTLCQFPIEKLHINDINENGLTEVIRIIRGMGKINKIKDIQTFVFDFGTSVMEHLIHQQQYDFVFNFAAVKHVRSEKDLYSLLHMLNVNIVKNHYLKDMLIKRNKNCKYFAISTDKAARPTSLMGASKRIMEIILFSTPEDFHVTSTRFANVAFSSGSLLESWTYRIKNIQVIAVPHRTFRYFISHQEASQICLLTAMLAPSHYITIPNLKASENLVLLKDVAAKFIDFMGFKPEWFDNEEEAIRSSGSLIKDNKWPILVTPLDTSGEKEYEEFLNDDEIAIEVGLKSIAAVFQKFTQDIPIDLINNINNFLENPYLLKDKSELIYHMKQLIPTLNHIETSKNLDSRV